MGTGGVHKVIQFGVGAAGGEMVRQMLNKANLQVVGAVDIDPELVGRDLGEVVQSNRKLGIPVKKTLAEVLAERQADVVLHATAPDIPRIVEDVSSCLQAGLNVVSISGIFHIRRLHPEFARQLEDLSKKHQVSLLGTGTAPGFFSDDLLCSLTAICEDVESLRFKRVVDLYEWGSGLFDYFGIGFTPQEFENGVKDNTLILHDRLLQSVDYIAATLGWEIDEVENIKEYLTADEERSSPSITIPPGNVCGFKHTVIGKRDGKVKVNLEYFSKLKIDPEKDGMEIGTNVAVEGSPSFNFTLGGELVENPNISYISVAAHAVNAIPHVINGPAGIVTRSQLPVFTPLKQ